MSYRILVIDHDPSGAERIQRPLTDAGYDVVVRSGAAEAMSAFEEVRPDLAVIEALLPEKSGPVLCQEIKDSPTGKATPVVLVLESDEDRQARARSLDLHGCDLLIERSIDEDELIELFEQLLRARLAQVEAIDEAPRAHERPNAESVRDGSGKLIDSDGVVDALSRLDAILDEQTKPDRVEATADGAKGPDAPPDQEKVKKAERAGDFSFLREEREEVGRRTPPSTAGDADESSHSTADTGQDIADHIDALFSASAPGEPTPAEKQVLSWTFENGANAKTVATSSSRPEAAEEEDPANQVPTPAAAAPQRESEPVEGPDASTEDSFTVEPSFEVVARPEDSPERKATPEAEAAPSEVATAAVQTATFASSIPRPAPEPGPSTEGKHRWWVVAACLTVVLIGGGLAVLFLGGGTDEPPAVTPVAPASPLVASAVAHAQPAPVEGASETPATTETTESVGAIEAAQQPDAAPPEPGPVPAASRPAPSPRSSPSSPPAQAETAKPPARGLPKTTTQTRPAVPTAGPGAAETPVAASKSAATETTSRQAEISPRNTTSTQPTTTEARATTEDPATTETAVPAGPALSAPEPAPESAAASTTQGESAVRPEPEQSAPAASPAAAAPPPEPAAPVLKPPKLLERSEPDYPPKSLKKAGGERIVLKLLISDRGRISRVLVERGTRFKDLEAAAVSAVLRWTYLPATEDGVAVEAWTTAEFTF